ncbi:RNA-guided endonuclease InsQ/TnpB family protein [Anaeromusa acidaminophila]|uniref:RNA-guided endonuclease InsQ/TnpB family protein n=1 Tax=Anaeromusa acidaminophila TaxID=81464 RepID=UPI000363159D|nr:RNA-guided endonuclease TnpB family protein [Anaeromusa acidaminophila]
MSNDTSKTRTIKTFKYRLYPSKEQAQIIDQTIETCRRLYNYWLEDRIYTYQEIKSSPTKFDQTSQLPKLKLSNPYLSLVHSQVLQDVAARLDKAYKNFFRRVKQGTEKPGFPKFKGRQHYDSFCYPQSGFNLGESHLQLSKIGTIKIKLHRPICGTIKTCLIVCKNGKYYACFSCEIEMQTMLSTGDSVGIDVGVADFVITSDGQFFPKLDKYRQAEKRLKYLQRQVSRRKKGSKRRRKAVALLAKQHEKVANQRRDIAHKVSRELVNNNDLIAHEDLQVKNMVKNHNLAKSITDAAWFMLFNFLAYKASDAGRQVVAVPPAYTSQICSGCGKLVPKKLSERWHNCPHCGLSIQRDVNAAINILAIALES